MSKMAGPAIGGVMFAATRVVVVDLEPVNRELQHPMDVILGAPVIRQTNWLFDFPARRGAAPELLAASLASWQLLPLTSAATVY